MVRVAYTVSITTGEQFPTYSLKESQDQSNKMWYIIKLRGSNGQKKSITPQTKNRSGSSKNVWMPWAKYVHPNDGRLSRFDVMRESGHGTKKIWSWPYADHNHIWAPFFLVNPYIMVAIPVTHLALTVPYIWWSLPNLRFLTFLPYHVDDHMMDFRLSNCLSHFQIV